MPDQTLQILIETITKGDGARATLADLRRLVQETNAGSKEAAAALDHWRATYGKLRNEMGAGYGNTGRGLATAPNLSQPYSGPLPPVIPKFTPTGESGGTGSAYAMRRHFGAMAGQILGMPGLGMMAAVGGMAAGVGVVTLALEKLVRVFTDFNAKVDEGAASMRKFELAGLSIDSAALRTQHLTQTNKEFALSYAQIDRQVHTVAAEIEKLRAIETHQISVSERRDRAATEAALAAAALQHRYNPIALIREREAIESAAFSREIQREREREQVQLRALDLQQKLTVARSARFAKEKQQLQEQLGPLQNAASLATFNEQATESDVALKVAAVEKARAAIQRFADGRDLTASAVNAAGAEMEALGLPNVASGMALLGSDAMLRRIGVPDKNGVFPKDSILGQLQDRRASAMANKNAASFALGQHMKRLGFADDEINKARTEFERTDVDRQVLQETINQTDPARNAAEESLKGAMRDRARLQELEAIPPVNIPPSGGGASNDPVLDRLDRIINIWTTGTV